MNSTKIGASVVGIAAAAAIILGALPAFAQTTTTGVAVSANTSVSTNQTTKLPALITKANTEIAARITDLNKLSTQVAAIKNESATEKANISAQVQTNITGLTALQAKIDADTDLSVARTDEGTIFTTFRIYALIVPRGYLMASADRITTIDGLMSSLGTQIQARITADQSAGKNVSAVSAALSDMQAKVADASTQSQSIQNGVGSLMPDQGNTTVAASNRAALVSARGNSKTATADLKTARTDITTMLQDLKSLGSVSTTASATAQ
jgi:hypothetical protein